MARRIRIVWKLSAIIIVIVSVIVVITGYVGNLICAHYSLESARAVLRFNSESIIKGIGRMMLNRNNAAVKEYIGDLSEGSDVYGDIRLVSHYSGEVVVSRYDSEGIIIDREDRSCLFCHGLSDPSEMQGVASFDEIIDLADGSRLLSHVTPIINEPGCRSADCHAHADAGSNLGFLDIDYSLERVDVLASARNAQTYLTIVIAIVVSFLAFWFLFQRFFGGPFGALLSGIRRISEGRLDFRFDASRSDEIGVLEKSFNTMTSRIQSHQAELKNAMDYLEGIVENSADIIITVNPEGRIQTFNRGAENALGHKRREIVGKRIETLFADPNERNAAIARLTHTDNVRNYETRFLTKDGRVRHVLLTLSRLRDPEGAPIGTFGISKDITEEKNLQKQLIQSERFAAIGQAMAGIQHAIKNMLNALKGGAYIVERGLAKDDREMISEGWVMAEEGISRITALSMSMLNYVKEWKPNLKETKPDVLANDIVGVVRQSAADKGVEVRAEVPDTRALLICDPEMIQMALMDIVSNAVDACTWKDYGDGQTPRVLVSVAVGGNGTQALFEVRDNGCGMTEEIRKDIFTPFFSTKKKWGTGLGLALTSRIINLHGGRINVESEPNRGTVFRITLPLKGPGADKEDD